MKKLFVTAIAIALHSSATANQELSETAVDKYLSILAPKESELWRTIPWKISLLDAQAEAAKTQKPLFIWAMDGHPLACV